MTDRTDTQPVKQPPGLISAECRDGRHGYQCSRNPRRMPSWSLLAVCQCDCHDARRGKERA